MVFGTDPLEHRSEGCRRALEQLDHTPPCHQAIVGSLRAADRTNGRRPRSGEHSSAPTRRPATTPQLAGALHRRAQAQVDLTPLGVGQVRVLVATLLGHEENDGTSRSEASADRGGRVLGVGDGWRRHGGGLSRRSVYQIHACISSMYTQACRWDGATPTRPVGAATVNPRRPSRRCHLDDVSQSRLPARGDHELRLATRDQRTGGQVVKESGRDQPDGGAAGERRVAVLVGLQLRGLDLAGLPGLVEPGFEWSVEAQDREPALAGDGSQPVDVGARVAVRVRSG